MEYVNCSYILSAFRMCTVTQEVWASLEFMRNTKISIEAETKYKKEIL